MRSRTLAWMGAGLVVVCVACGGSSGDDTLDAAGGSAGSGGSRGAGGSKGSGGTAGGGGSSGSHHDGGSTDATQDTTVTDVSTDTSTDVTTSDHGGDVVIRDGGFDAAGVTCGELVDGGKGAEYFGPCPGFETCCPGNTPDRYYCKALDGGMCPLLP